MEEVPDETKREGRGRESRRGRRKGEVPGKARRRLFKVRCKLCRPSAASIGRLFVQPPTQSTSFHLIKTPRPCRHTTTGLSHDSLSRSLPRFFHSFTLTSPSSLYALIHEVFSPLRIFELTRLPTLQAYRIPTS